jgi:hypothetical protein
MIALLARLVRDAGGTIVWIDTDGACIVMTETGGLIPCGVHRAAEGDNFVKALSFGELQSIRGRFATLVDGIGFPLTADPGGIRSVFKLEEHNLDEQGRFAPGLECFVVSTKNYCVFRRDPDGSPVADPGSKFSAHAMGNLVSPLNPETNDPAWISEAWLWWLARDEGRKPPEPGFLELPVTHAMLVAHADDYRLIRTLNSAETYDEGIKPFDTLLLAHLDRFLLAEGSPRQLLALWEADTNKWLLLDWRDPATGAHHSLQTRPETSSYRRWQKRPGAVFCETFRSYLEKHFTHPEPASLGPDGQPSGRDTRGVLQPVPIRIERQQLVGKETHRLRERRVGWRTTEQERTTFSKQEWLYKQVMAIFDEMNERQLRADGIEPRTVRKVRARSGHSISPQLATRLEQAAASFARDQLRAQPRQAPLNPQATIDTYLAMRSTPTCEWPGCDTPLNGRQRRWCTRHARRSGADRTRSARR